MKKGMVLVFKNRREVILKALEQKQTESILTKSPEELQEMLKNLS